MKNHLTDRYLPSWYSSVAGLAIAAILIPIFDMNELV